MSKKRILIVDPEPKSARLLEMSFRAAGYHVTVATCATEATTALAALRPHAIVCDTDLNDLSAFDFLKNIKNRPEWRDIPFVFLSSDNSLENKLHGLELGADEYLPKPIYIREVITRIGLLIKRKSDLLEGGASETTRFSGQLTEMGLVDLLQTMELNRKSGAMAIASSQGNAAIYFRDGHLVDATIRNNTFELQGPNALYRALTWQDGRFEVNFRKVRRDDRIGQTIQTLVMEGMRRLDEWNLLLSSMPPLDALCDINVEALREKSNILPDDCTRILRYVNGKTSLRQILDNAVDPLLQEPTQDLWDDLAALRLLARLFQEKVLLDTGARAPRWMVSEDEDLSRVASNSENPPHVDITTSLASSEPRFSATIKPEQSQQPDPKPRVPKVEQKSGTKIDSAGKFTSAHTVGFENLEAPLLESQELSFFRRAERDSHKAAKEHAVLQDLVRRGEAVVVSPRLKDASMTPEQPSKSPLRRTIVVGTTALLVAAISFFAMPQIAKIFLAKPAPGQPPNPVASPAKTPATTARTPVVTAEPPIDIPQTPSAIDRTEASAPPPEPMPPTAADTTEPTLWKDLRRQALRALDRGQDIKAEALSRQALESEPAQSEAWLVLGAALDAQGKHAEAQQAYQTCVKQGLGSEVIECQRLIRKR